MDQKPFAMDQKIAIKVFQHKERDIEFAKAIALRGFPLYFITRCLLV